MLYGKPLIKPSTIEGELEKIRMAAAADDAADEKGKGSTPAARVKATLKNIILINAKGSNRAADTDIDSLIDKLCVAHPSRFFIVDGNLDPERMDLATAVSSRCFLAESGLHVCSEEIYVSASERSSVLVPNLLLSLLAPDVDVVVVLLGNPEDISPAAAAILGGIAKLSDLLLFDSCHCRQYLGGLVPILGAANITREMYGVLAADPSAKSLADINWPRLRRWRGLVAEGFDAAKFVDSADETTEVSFVINGDPSQKNHLLGSAEAWLMAGWIISSLSLRVGDCRSNGTSSVEFDCTRIKADESLKGKNCLLKFEVSSYSAAAASGALSSIDFKIVSDSFEGSLRVDRRFDKGTAEISMGITHSEAEPDNSCEFTVRSLPFSTQDFSDEILSALVARRPESTFRRALQAAVVLADLAGSKT